MIEISVLIAAYNAEEYIEKCLDSIVFGDMSKLEIVVVNDGSTDKTDLLIKNYIKNNTKNIKYIKTENKGVSAARNTCLINSSGNYVVFVDADDRLTENSLDIMYENITSNRCDIIVGGWNICDKNGKYLFQGFSGESSVLKDIDFLKKCIDDSPLGQSSFAKMYKKDFINELRFVEGKKINEDSFFVFECSLKRPHVVTLEGTFYNYTKNMQSSSYADFSEKFFDIIYFAEKKVSLIEKEFPQYMEQSKNILLRAHMHLLQNLTKTNEKKYDLATKQSMDYIKNNSKGFKSNNLFECVILFVVKFHLYKPYKILYRKRLSLQKKKNLTKN